MLYAITIFFLITLYYDTRFYYNFKSMLFYLLTFQND